MTQKEKELLLKDLSARLPYEVKLFAKFVDGIDAKEGKGRLGFIDADLVVGFVDENADNSFTYVELHEVKPYLFPMSSMTEEQKEELFKFCEFYISEDWEGKKSEVYGIKVASRLDPAYCYDHNFNMWNIDMRAINWLLKNHFDIYGLIHKELAIDATGLNIY